MTDIDQYRLNRIDELIEENDKLRAKVKETNELRARIKEYELKDILRRDSFIYVNTYLQDCDGVERYNTFRVKTMEEYNEQYESFVDSIEGRYSWDVVSLEDTYQDDECGTFGHGWDIN